MNWYHRIFHRSGQKEDVILLLNLRCTRFRQLVRNYGKILDALADAAEKQAGDYILDRQYTVSLSEVVLDLTEAIIFDLNILAGQRYDSFYHLLDRFRSEVRDTIAVEGGAGGSTNSGTNETVKVRTRTSPDGLNKLTKAIAESRVLYQRAGRVACRGVAAGPVFNLETEDSPDAFTQGAVMVASDIVPDDELIRLMRQASAILIDLGEPAGDAATLAREFGIPTIAGLGDASKRLETTGSEITVDADENTVYQGRIEELLEYYETERLDQEEETEYRILRRLRRLMFALTLEEDAETGAELGDCKTLHDLVHLAHELAGDAQFELIMNLRDFKKTSARLATSSTIPFYVMDVGGGLVQGDRGAATPDVMEIRSIPMRMFVQGMDQMFREGPRLSQPGNLRLSVMATVTEEHANMIVEQAGDFDIVDSMIGESRDSNHIYCRFASTARGKENKAVRGAVACEILSRLDFAAAQTTRATAAWLSGVPRNDMEERLTIIGRLGAYLLETDAAGWDGTSRDAYVNTFIARHA
jgi:pyruvate,water dikinase